MANDNTRRELLRSCRGKVLVKFTRPFEGGSFRGYVLDIGPKFFLLSLIGDDGIRFNGFSCLRLVDIRNLRVPHKYAAFIESALKKLRERKPNKPPVALDSLQELLRSASRHFTLVTIHRERVEPDVCHIGRIEEVTQGQLLIREIGPDAVWETEPETYRLAEITRVDFGGGYERALYLVGGEPTRRK